MKALRLWLLVLLAALLPLRGAMAAAMLCGPAMHGMQSEMRASAPPAHERMHEHMHDHAMHGPGDVGAAHDEHASPSQDKCNLCSAFCSLTPLLSEMPRLPAPHELAAVSYPEPGAPAPSFLSGGPERPPRSI